jgi:hypothetical protein
MGGASLPQKVITAFRSAGATEEMIARAGLVFASLPREAPGRPRKYRNSKEADHAYYVRKRDRLREMQAISPKNGAKPLPGADRLMQHESVVAREEASPPVSLQQRLEEACQANYDARVSVEPIEALLAQGCDLEADVLPTVARTVPELPRPLKNWGAKWLVREIMSRDEFVPIHGRQASGGRRSYFRRRPELLGDTNEDIQRGVRRRDARGIRAGAIFISQRRP